MTDDMLTMWGGQIMGWKKIRTFQIKERYFPSEFFGRLPTKCDLSWDYNFRWKQVSKASEKKEGKNWGKMIAKEECIQYFQGL